MKFHIGCALFMLASLFNGFCGSSKADGLRTYTFAPNQNRELRIRGGLLGIDIEAGLTGSFDVVVGGDGQSVITRFDITLTDVVDNSLYPTTWVNGSSLADILFVSPLGLTGTSSGSSLVLGQPAYVNILMPVLDDPDTLIPSLHFNGPNTLLKIEHVEAGLATLKLDSNSSSQLDVHAIFTDSSGGILLVVPEPTSQILTACGLIAVSGLRRRRSRVVIPE